MFYCKFYITCDRSFKHPPMNHINRLYSYMQRAPRTSDNVLASAIKSLVKKRLCYMLAIRFNCSNTADEQVNEKKFNTAGQQITSQQNQQRTNQLPCTANTVITKTNAQSINKGEIQVQICDNNRPHIPYQWRMQDFIIGFIIPRPVLSFSLVFPIQSCPLNPCPSN